MTSSPTLPPSGIWKAFKTVKGVYNATATVPEVDLRGKWVLITGSNNGIGREAAIWFARSGANLILACRQPPPHEVHPEQVVEECKAAAADQSGEHRQAVIVEWWECDMADLSSVAALAQRWNETNRPLDILCNNAGMGTIGPPVLTKDGFEICHQVNFLSHTLLTLSVLPSIARASSPRIICTTSCMHYAGTYDLSNANAGGKTYSNNKLYFQIWLSELQLRLLRHPDYDHVILHGVHPGFVDSGIFLFDNDPDRMPKNAGLFFWTLTKLLGLVAIDSQQGSLAIVNAATAPELGLRRDAGGDEFRGGARYFNRLWEDDPNPYTRDATSRKEVWDFILSELDSSKKFNVSEELRKEILT